MKSVDTKEENMDIQNTRKHFNNVEYYVSLLQSRADFFQSDSVETLIERQIAVWDASLHLKVAFYEFLSAADNIPYEMFDEYKPGKKIKFDDGSKSAEILERLQKIIKLTYYTNEAALALSIEDMQENLRQAYQIASALPMLLNAVNAGEDEGKAQIVDGTVNQEDYDDDEEETLSQTVRRISAEIEETSDDDKLAELYFELGEAYYKHKNWNNAEINFSKAIERIPNRSKIQFTEDGDMIMGGQTYSDLLLAQYKGRRGYCYYQLDKNEEAIEDLRDSLKEAFDENNWCYLGWAYAAKGDHSNAIFAFTKVIEVNEDAFYFKERGDSYFAMEDYQNALNDFKEVLQNSDDESNAEIKKSIQTCCEKIQENQTLEERITPYIEKINQLKKDGTKSKSVENTDNERVELFAVMCLLEEYDLLEWFFREYGKKYINDTLNPELVYWQPTVLYWLTAKKPSTMMKDLHSMLRFLVENGADPNIPDAEGSTMLWNQSTEGFTDTGTMKLLLELGANPNRISYNDDFGIYPLQNCLIAMYGDDYDEEKDNWQPYTQVNIDKAILLLEHGANPNLTTEETEAYKPLVLAITFGPKNLENQNLIKLLVEKGANTDYLEITGLYAKVDCQVRPGRSGEGKTVEYFSKDDVFSKDVLQVDNHYIYLSERTEKAVKGKILFDKQIPCGDFELDILNSPFETGFINVCHDMVMNCTVGLEFGIKSTDDTDLHRFSGLSEDMVNLLGNVEDYAFFPPASTEANIKRCNAELKSAKYPELPADYTEFLLCMDGFAFNSVQLFGDAIIRFPDENFVLADILQENERMKSVYGKAFKNRLIIGRDNDDYYIWHPERQKYEVHSHECFGDIYDEWDTFEELFVNNCGKYLYSTERDDDGRYDAWA